MNVSEIIRILDGTQPIAIVRYFIWTAFSKSYSETRYIMLRLDSGNRDIDQEEIPQNLVYHLLPRLEGFEEIHRNSHGTVWERHGFAQKARALVPKAKLMHFISSAQ